MPAPLKLPPDAMAHVRMYRQWSLNACFSTPAQPSPQGGGR